MSKETVDCVLAIVQIATLFALIIYVWKTWQMASATRKAVGSARETVAEMKASREAEYRPYLVSYFEIVRNNIILFTVKNNGKSQAKDITVSFNPEMNATQHEDKIRNILSKSFNKFSLQPQQELKTYIDQIGRYLKNPDFPRSYEVSVRYHHGNTDKQYKDIFRLDIGVYEGLLVLDEKGIAAVVDKLENIGRKADSIASSLKKI